MSSLVLGIESTCDETGASVVKDGSFILSNVIASQIDLQTTFGGVVPELACRRHVDVFIPVVQKALLEADVTLDEIHLIAAAYGPGLIGALFIGLEGAKGLSFAKNIPFVGVNHIEAHLYAAYMTANPKPTFPCLGAVLSGGHTSLVLIHDWGSYFLISQTVDDAVGEAFDKVARILHLPYPGGPYIERHAKLGDPNRFSFKAGTVKKDPFAFSFSGLKTAVLYAVQKLTPPYPIDDIAASFQKAAIDDIVQKTLLAAKQYDCKSILIGGGVSQNLSLQKELREKGEELSFFFPPPSLCGDNAAMIAGLGYQKWKSKGKDSFDLAPVSRLGFTDSP